MAKLKNASKPPFYKTGPLYLHNKDHKVADKSKKSDDKVEVNPDPVKYFKGLESKAIQRTTPNPYPKESVRARKFDQLQKRLESSSM